MNIDEIEQRDGVRLTWNSWPSTNTDAEKFLDIPLGIVYQPLGGLIGQENQIQDKPVQCRCKAYCNPYCTIDNNNGIWICPFCNARNQIPTDVYNFNGFAYSTVEYVDTTSLDQGYSIIFCIDSTASKEELDELKSSLPLAIAGIPHDVKIGLVVYGKNVTVYDLTYNECPRGYVFSGNKTYTSNEVNNILKLSTTNKCLVEFEECELNLMSILEDITTDEWDIKQGCRPFRCTGSAINICLGIAESSKTYSHVILLTTGPCTYGPGKIVDLELKNNIRSHTDIQQNNAPYVSSATKYYDDLADRFSLMKSAVTIMACSMDQTGMLEMANLANRTGGWLTMHEAYSHPTFRDTISRLLDSDEFTNMKYQQNVNLKVISSNEIKSRSLIGHALSADRKDKLFDLTTYDEIGIPGNEWVTSMIDKQTAFVILLNIVNPSTNPLPEGKKGIVQLITTYTDNHKFKRTRVTTISREFTSPTKEGLIKMSQGFDQETAAVVLARCSSFKADDESKRDAMRWLDKALLRTCNKFGIYRKDDINSFTLSPNFSILPQFMYHLRRSHFLQVFNCSPDETRYFRHALMRSNVLNSLTMIQPTLDCYKYGQESKPVLLSMNSVESDSILLLDTYFYIVVFRGEAVASWIKNNLAEQPEYQGLKQFYQQPEDDAHEMGKDRIPAPRIYVCNQYSGHQRFLFTILDPAVTASSEKKDLIVTEDVTLKVFMEHLKRLSVLGNI